MAGNHRREGGLEDIGFDEKLLNQKVINTIY
jgi:hypothetical protein